MDNLEELSLKTKVKQTHERNNEIYKDININFSLIKILVHTECIP